MSSVVAAAVPYATGLHQCNADRILVMTTLCRVQLKTSSGLAVLLGWARQILKQAVHELWQAVQQVELPCEGLHSQFPQRHPLQQAHAVLISLRSLFIKCHSVFIPSVGNTWGYYSGESDECFVANIHVQ